MLSLAASINRPIIETDPCEPEVIIVYRDGSHHRIAGLSVLSPNITADYSRFTRIMYSFSYKLMEIGTLFPTVLLSLPTRGEWVEIPRTASAHPHGSVSPHAGRVG